MPHREEGVARSNCHRFGNRLALTEGDMLSKTGLLDRLRRVARVMILSSGLAALVPFPAIAASSVTLAWNSSTGTNIAGYKIYYGAASGTYKIGRAHV